MNVYAVPRLTWAEHNLRGQLRRQGPRVKRIRRRVTGRSGPGRLRLNQEGLTGKHSGQPVDARLIRLRPPAG